MEEMGGEDAEGRKRGGPEGRLLIPYRPLAGPPGASPITTRAMPP